MKVVQIAVARAKFWECGDEYEGTSIYALTDDGAIWAQYAGESEWKLHEKAGFLESANGEGER